MPRSYELTNKAVEDLTNIWEYTIDKWSENQADKYYTSLLTSCQTIANNPEIGKVYFDITPTLYGFKINIHIIFYRKQIDQPVTIIRILHERMDLQNRLSD